MRALITGAAAGLARGVAIAFARSGWFDGISITYRTTPPDETLAAVRREAGATPIATSAHRVDFFDDEATIGGVLDEAVRADGPFDVLVHGVGPMLIKRFEDSTARDYQEMFDGNVRSAVLAAHAVLPAMRERRFGRLIFFGMMGASITKPMKGFSLHLASKSALVAFARTLAIEEAGHGITCNVIEPGDIRDKTQSRAEALARGEPAKNPRGRPGTWEDVADAALFFADPSRDFITGTVLPVNGGWA